MQGIQQLVGRFDTLYLLNYIFIMQFLVIYTRTVPDFTPVSS